jgi:hypothetical protein
LIERARVFECEGLKNKEEEEEEEEEIKYN